MVSRIKEMRIDAEDSERIAKEKRRHENVDTMDKMLILH